jgi:hypothetical protein
LIAELLHTMAAELDAEALDNSRLVRHLVLLNSVSMLASYLRDWSSRLRYSSDSVHSAFPPSDDIAQVLEDGFVQFDELARTLRKTVLTSCLVQLSVSLEPYFAMNASEETEEKRLVRASTISCADDLALTVRAYAGTEIHVSLLRSLSLAIEELLQVRRGAQHLRAVMLPIFSK